MVCNFGDVDAAGENGARWNDRPNRPDHNGRQGIHMSDRMRPDCKSRQIEMTQTCRITPVGDDHDTRESR